MSDENPPQAATEPAPAAPRAASDPTVQAASSALTEALAGLLRVALKRGGKEARKFADSSRVRLDLRQLKRDRDVMYQKLGREVRALVEGGEVVHPGLTRGVERIEELDARIAAVGLGTAASTPDDAAGEE